MIDLNAFINTIGSELVNCSNKLVCQGINFNPEKGVFPRCLYLETDGRDLDKQGCVIIGLNPGTILDKEEGNGVGIREKNKFSSLIKFKDLTLEQDRESLFQEQNKFFNEDIKNNVVYYRRIKAIINFLEIKGPILWTELVKCECPKSSDGLIKSTVYNCATKYLFKELEMVPKEWPIFAIGDETYRYLLLRESIKLIGLPHASQMYGKVISKDSAKMDFKNLLLPEDDIKFTFSRDSKQRKLINKNRSLLKTKIITGKFPFQFPREQN
jgi:hypothetical protein